MDKEQIQAYLQIFSDNPYYQAAIVVVLGLIVAKIINVIFTRIILRIAHKTKSVIDNQLIHITRPALFYSTLLVSLAIAANIALSESSETIAYSVLLSIAIFIWSIFIVQLAKILLRSFAGNPQHFSVVSSQTLPLFENLAIILVIGTSVYLIFSAWHIDMTAWLASAGIIGIAIGFAAKDTLANLFSGVFILADAPYKIGDYVVLDSGERGAVTNIGIRSTRILTRDDVEVTIPNSIMGNTKIINESGGPHTKYRIRVKVGVAYGSDIDQVKNILLEVGINDEDVCKDPEPRVRFRQFGASSLDLELLCWVEEPMLRGKILDVLNTAIYKRFHEEGVEIPYSKHDVFIKEMPSNQP